MKRRDLLKSVLFAPFAGLLKGKKKPVDPKIANIDSNSEWAKQKLSNDIYGTPDMLYSRKNQAEKVTNFPYVIEWGTNKKYYLNEKRRS